MAFLTAEQIRAVRIKGSKVVKVEAIEKEVRVVKMSSAAALAAGELQGDVKAGKRKQSEIIPFLLAHGVADIDGNLLTGEDVQSLLEVLPMSDVTKLVGEVSTLMNAGDSASESLGK